MWKQVDSNKIVGTQIKVPFPLSRFNPIKIISLILKKPNPFSKYNSLGNHLFHYQREKINTTNVHRHLFSHITKNIKTKCQPADPDDADLKLAYDKNYKLHPIDHSFQQTNIFIVKGQRKKSLAMVNQQGKYESLVKNRECGFGVWAISMATQMEIKYQIQRQHI